MLALPVDNRDPHACIFSAAKESIEAIASKLDCCRADCLSVFVNDTPMHADAVDASIRWVSIV